MKNLGRQGVDKITGFTGTITGFCTYLTGCSQYLIVPRCKDSNTQAEGQWVDTSRVDVTENKLRFTLHEDEPNGPDKAPPVL